MSLHPIPHFLPSPSTLTLPPCDNIINFSGGRSSALMLRILLHLDILSKPNTHLFFCNTGKEREETLQFVHDIEQNFELDVKWIEYRNNKKGFEIVSFDSASRKGEPFKELIKLKGYLPNRVARFCTQELKITPVKKYLNSIGIFNWNHFIGIRYDEPLRWGPKLNQQQHEPYFYVMPLVQLGITQSHVQRWAKTLPFNLSIHSNLGNCDLCFLKGKANLIANMRHDPNSIQWWLEQENQQGSTFSSRYSIAELAQLAINQTTMFKPADFIDYPCFCNAD